MTVEEERKQSKDTVNVCERQRAVQKGQSKKVILSYFIASAIYKRFPSNNFKLIGLDFPVKKQQVIKINCMVTIKL